jgi:hypothetical protein
MAHSRFFRKPLDLCSSRGLMVATLGLTIVSSCHRAPPEVGVKGIMVAGLPSRGVNAFFSTNFPGVPSVAGIAGYNDAQRLPGDGANDYGAIVRLYVAPQAPTQTQEDQGVLVAVMEVEGGNGQSQSAYNMLKIDNVAGPQLYCVFVQTGNPAGSYDGFVTPVQSDGTTCTPFSNKYKLSANAVDPTDPDAPYVARFLVDPNGKPAIGVGCGTPPNYMFCHLGRGLGSDKKPVDDQQDVAIPASGGVSRSMITGRITAMTTTGFGMNPVQAATINLSTAPPNPSRYYTWGLAQGDNGVWLSKDAQNNWWAQFVPGSTAPTNQPFFQVSRIDHSGMGSPAVPAAARWLWSDTDEDAWIACDQGCCTISGLTGESRNERGHNRP